MEGFFLTEAMLELILASLPLHSLAVSRSVCRAWNALIVSSSFARLLSSFPANGEMDTDTCTSTDKREIWILRQDKRCHKVEAFTCLPSSSSSSSSPSRWLFTCPFAVAASRRVLASDKGLILLALSDSFKTLPHPYLVVWNPLRSSWRELPLSSLFKDGFVFAFCFTHDEESGTFKVLLSSFTEVNYYSTAHSSPITMIHRTEVFDSYSGAWEQGAPVLLCRRRKCSSNVIWFHGRFHCILDGCLWSYNLHNKVWSQTRSETRNGTRNETQNRTRYGTQNETRNGTRNETRDRTHTDTLNQSQNETPNGTLNETLTNTRNESLIQTQHETRNRTQNHAPNQPQNETLNQIRNETQNETLNQTQREIQNRTRNKMLVQIRGQTQNEIHNETLNQTQNETLNQNENETQNEIVNQTQNETQNRTQSQTFNQSQNETQNEAQNGTGNQSRDRSRNETLIQTQIEAQNQTRNETRNRPQNETHNRAQNEIINQTQSETRNRPPNETQNRTRNHTQNETRNRTGTIVGSPLVESDSVAPAPFTILAASGKGLYKIPFEAGIRTLSAFRMGLEGAQDWVHCHKLPEDLCSILWDEEANLWNIWRDWRECCILGEHIFFCLGKKNPEMLLYNVFSNRFSRLDNIPLPSSSSDCTLHFIFQPGFQTAL